MLGANSIVYNILYIKWYIESIYDVLITESVSGVSNIFLIAIKNLCSYVLEIIEK